MRVFYIYNVNDFFTSVYDKYPYKLYNHLLNAGYASSLIVQRLNNYF